MSDPGIVLNLNFEQEFERIINQMNATPRQITKASQRATRNTIRWLKTRIAREVCRSLGIQQKALKTRLVNYTEGTGSHRSHGLWFGIAPIAAENAGRLRQNAKGVTVGKSRFQGAFYKQVYGERPATWVRNHRALSLGLDLPEWSRKDSANSLGVSDGRFPVRRVSFALEPVAREVFRRYERRAADRFAKELERELNYAVNIENNS